MSNIVGLPSVSDSPKTTFFVGDIQKLSTDKVDITLYNGTPFSLSSARKRHDGELYVAEVKYRTDDYIAGLELSYDIEGFKIVDIVYSWKDKDSQLNIKNYITQVSKSNKKIISYFNPDITSLNILESTDYITKNTAQDQTAFFVLLEKTSEENYFKITEKFKTVKNLNNSGVSILEPVPRLSKWDINIAFGPEALKNSSYIKRAAQMAITDLYDESIDIDSSLNTIDVLDIVGLCNHRWYSLNHDAVAVNGRIYVPSYVEIENSYVSKTDLVDADLKIKNVDIQYNDNSFDLAIDIGFNASVTAHGWQFDIGRNWESYSFINKEDNSLIKPNVVFKGQLEELKKFYDYRVVSIDNRFGYDNITRVSVYRKPFNGEDPSALVDVSRQNILLNSHGTKPRKYSETILRLEWNNIKKVSNLNLLPRKEFYIKKDTESFSDLIQNNIDTYKKGDRWYGSVNYDQETSTWYTGETFNPYSSVELEVKWDLFGMLNRKAITNSNLNFIKHYSRTEQDLVNFSYQFAYPEEGSTADLGVLEKYGNDFQAYAESVLGYVNSTITNGLSSGPQSKYDYEPIVPDGYVAGYMNDHDLSGTKNIVDTSALSNLFTIRISTNADGDSQEAITSNAVKNIIDNRIVPGERSSNDVPGKRVYMSSAVEKRILDSLNKIVPTLIINENNTLTYPQFDPTIIDNNSDGSMIFFSEALECGANNFPKEFRSWKHYFSEMYDIPHTSIPTVDDFFFFQVNLSTTSDYAKFLGLTRYVIDFSDSKSGSDNLKVLNLDGIEVHQVNTQDNFVSIYTANNLKEREYSTTMMNESSAGVYSFTLANFDKLHISTFNPEPKPLLSAISSDGGTLGLCSIFIFGPDIKSKEDIQIKFSDQDVGYYTTGGGGVESQNITWADIARPGDDNDVIVDSLENNTLFFGPKLSYKNFYLKDNSTSARTYDDVDIFLQIENKREVTIKTLGSSGYTTGSFSLLLNDTREVNIDDFSTPFQSVAPIKTEDGIQKWDLSYSSSTDITGSVEVARIKFSENIFEDEIEDLDPNVEVIYPPKGLNKTLIAPNIDENYVYPTWENCFFYSDSSDENYFEISGSEVEKMSDLFSSNYISKPSGFEGPLRDKQLTFGKELSTVRFVPEKLLNGSWDYYLDHNNPIDLSFNLNLGETVNSIKEQFKPQFTNNRIIDFTFFKYDTSGSYNNELVSNILKVHLGYEKTDCSYYDSDFHVLNPNDQDRNQRYYPLRDVAGVESRILTEADIEAGYVVDENTRYISNYYIESNGSITYLTLAEIETKLEGEKNSNSLDYGFPYYHFTVNKDGDLFLKSDYPAELETYLARDNSQGGWLGLFNALYDLVIIQNTNDGIKDNIYSKRFAFWWNSKHFDGFRVKDDNGSEVYLRDENGKILGDTRRWFLEIKAQSNILHPDIMGDPTNTINLYFPSQYEKLNQEFFSDTERFLDGNLFSFNFNISEITSSVRMWINGNEVISSGELWFPESFQSTASPYPTIQVGNVFQTSGLKRFSINMGTLQDGYTVYYPNDHELNNESFFFDKTEYSFGEILASNYDFSDNERDLLVATIMGKWGFEDLMNPNNIFYGEEVNTLRASFTNESSHPDKLALDAVKKYSRLKNFRTDSTRFSSKAIERKLQFSNASFDNLNMSTFNARKLPPGFELTPPGESKVYISKWDEERGMLHVSYRSNKKVDAFQIELGNFIDNPEEYLLARDATGVGIIDTYNAEIMDKRKWGTPVIGKGPGNYPHEKVNKIIYAVAPELNLDPEGPYPSRALGSWPLPATTRGSATELCIIKVDPEAFKGSPIIENFSLVSNDTLATPDTGFVGSTAAGDIISRTGSLQDVEDLVRSGYFYTNSGSQSQTFVANRYDADGNNYVDVADYISIRNHITLNGEVANQGNNFVPLAYTSSYANLPDYNFSVSLSDDVSALSASLSWTQNGPDAADSFQIWRRSFNVNNQSVTSGKWELFTSLSGSSWLDQEPPINRLAEQQEDNPEFEYLLVASNQHGTRTYNSQTFQFPPYFNGDLLVNDISVTTYKGKEVVIMPSYYDDNSAAPPFGNNTNNPSNFEFNFSPPDKAAGKFIKEATQNIFHFDPDYSNFVGRLTGTYEVVNTRTGDWKEGQYVINVLPKPFDLEYSQTKIVDAYSNVIYFDLNDVGSVDYVALQRTSTPGSWAGSRVGEWIKTKDLENNIVRIEDVINASDFGDFSSSQTFYYRILAYEDINDDSDLDQGTDLEVLSNVLTVVCASREKLETYTFGAPTANSCTLPNPTVTFQIPQLTSSLNTPAKSYSVERVDGNNYTVADVYHNTGSNPIDVSLDVDRVAGCNELYFRSFRVVGLSEDLMTTEYNVFTASLDKCPNTPVAKSTTVKACLNEEFQGDLKVYLSNASEDVSLASFTEVGSLVGLSLNSDGTFSYTPTSTTSVSFDYTGTSCGITSNTGTITFEVSDECVLCPDDQEEVICRYAKINQEYPEFAGHTPLKYKDRNVSNIRLRDLQEEYEVSSNKS